MTTALFMLRCVELGLNIGDLDLLTIGSVNDMFSLTFSFSPAKIESEKERERSERRESR